MKLNRKLLITSTLLLCTLFVGCDSNAEKNTNTEINNQLEELNGYNEKGFKLVSTNVLELKNDKEIKDFKLPNLQEFKMKMNDVKLSDTNSEFLYDIKIQNKEGIKVYLDSDSKNISVIEYQVELDNKINKFEDKRLQEVINNSSTQLKAVCNSLFDKDGKYYYNSILKMLEEIDYKELNHNVAVMEINKIEDIANLKRIYVSVIKDEDKNVKRLTIKIV